MKILVLAIGKLRGPEAELCAEYGKRLGTTVTVQELAAPKSLTGPAAQKAEHELLSKALPQDCLLIMLDERGKELPSRVFADKLQSWQDSGRDLVFMIGGADGFLPELREKADFLLSLGTATWPHRLARVMLLEQLYRARQINAGHPYHRD